MGETTYRCDGCGAELVARADLALDQGSTRRAWRCETCGTTVPAVVAERIQHQTG